jgi:hypothetical protein
MIFAGRLGHQTTHTGQLANLFDATTSTGVGHQVHRIDVAVPPRSSFSWRHHFGRDLLAGVGPGVEHLVVPFDPR